MFIRQACFSQHEDSKWYFGGYAALDFMTNPPTVLNNSAMLTHEGCSSIANGAGSLLFYTDGSTVYNSANQVMANGLSLLGDNTPCQSSVIARKPGSTSLYYIFTVEGMGGNAGLNYSIVDMTLAAGLGSVTVKNSPLHPAPCTEQIAGTRHCNGSDIWIVVHDYSSSQFHSYLLTSAGVSTTGVTSVTGGSATTIGSLKFSPNGRKLGLGNYTSGTWMFDFDNTTGIVSNGFALNASFQPYGCEFSPDGTKFYATAFIPTIGTSALRQWDLCATSSLAIIASEYAVPNAFNGMYSMQRAPNGKIYIASGSPTLNVINNPNASGSACNFAVGAQTTVPTNTISESLPNFILNSLQPTVTPFTDSVSYAYGCQTASFTSNYSPPNCSLTSFSLLAMQWDFGDPLSGAANTSTLNDPTHQFTTVGSYTVRQIFYYSCGGGNDTVSRVVNINTPCLTFSHTPITCASLGSATVMSQGAGPYTYTWMPTNQTGSVAAGLSPGNYTLTVYDAGHNFTYTTTITFIAPVPLTGNVAYSPSVACNGAVTATAAVNNISGGSGSQYYWWSNGTDTYTTASPSLSAGLWSLTVTDALTGCQINQQFYISQPPAISITALGSASACVNTSVALTCTASGGVPALNGSAYTYSWINGYSGTLQTVSENSAGIHNYTVTATDSLHCSGSQTVAVNFIALPLLAVSDISICPLQTGTLMASGASSYTWSSGTATASGNTFTASPLTNFQYTVTGEALGCSSLTTANVFLMPAPVPTVSSNGLVCENGILALDASGGVAYAWSGPAGFTSTAASNTITFTQVSAGGIYQVTVTAANSCTATASLNVTVNALPTLSLSPANTSLCANTSSAVLHAISNATLFSWQPNQYLSSANTATVLAFSPVTQVYTVTVSLNSCSNVAMVTVNVVPPPNLNISLSSPTACADILNGSPNTITLTAGGANTYTITTPNDIFNSNPAGPVTNFNALPPHIPGVATASVYGSNGVCTVSTTAVFTIIPNPTISISNPTPVICAGETFTYTNAGASSYTWSSSTPGQTLYTVGNTAIVSPTAGALFSVFGGSLGCNSATQSTTITVNPLPVVYIDPDPAVTCLHVPLTLTATGTGSSYQWFSSGWLGNPLQPTLSVDPPAQQNYTVVASLNSCTASANITVIVLPLPDISIGSSSQNVLCLSQSFTLQGFGGSDYSWQFPNYLTATGATVRIQPTDISYSGIYTLTAQGINGCSNTSTINMMVENNPTGYLKGSNLSNCVPFAGNYKFIPANFPSSDITVTGWQVNNSLVQQGDHFTYQFVSPGNYFITATVTTQQGCSHAMTFTIEAYPKPMADFSFSPQYPVEDLDNVNFSALQDQTITNFQWYFVNNDPGNQSTHANPTHVFETAGVYPVALLVKNQWGCADSVVKVVTVEPDFSVYVPNAFTPNADDRNDLFYPVTRGVKTLKFMIFDRWDELLFSTNTISSGWDGNYKGQPCQQDVYVWKLEATGVNNETKKLTGFVTLYR